MSSPGVRTPIALTATNKVRRAGWEAWRIRNQIEAKLRYGGLGQHGGRRQMRDLGRPGRLIDSFEPEVVEAMRMAYRMACEALQLRDQIDAITDDIAKKILELAEAGETDADRLCAIALRRLLH
jgi:hypothetical protein